MEDWSDLAHNKEEQRSDSEEPVFKRLNLDCGTLLYPYFDALLVQATPNHRAHHTTRNGRCAVCAVGVQLESKHTTVFSINVSVDIKEIYPKDNVPHGIPSLLQLL